MVGGGWYFLLVLKKTSLYLDPAVDRGIARIASREGVTKAEAIRRNLAGEVRDDAEGMLEVAARRAVFRSVIHRDDMQGLLAGVGGFDREALARALDGLDRERPR